MDTGTSWDALSARYLILDRPRNFQILSPDDGRIEIDNNSAERSIRPLVLGRRNYLFAGSDAGGDRAAAIYSLIGTAMINGVEPYGYLRHVPIRGAAVAHDGHKTLVMLRRRPREAIPDLLARLDAAIDTAKTTGARVDEINTKGAAPQYEL